MLLLKSLDKPRTLTMIDEKQNNRKKYISPRCRPQFYNAVNTTDSLNDFRNKIFLLQTKEILQRYGFDDTLETSGNKKNMHIQSTVGMLE